MPDIDNLFRTFYQALNRAEKADAVSFVSTSAPAEQALQTVIPTIRAMLLGNFKSSGIQSRTGTLQKAISRADIKISRQGKITIAMPKSMSTQFYKYSASLNHGWVVGKAGRAAKKLIKKSGAKVEGMHVVKARPYFFLSASQKAEIAALYNEAYAKITSGNATAKRA